VTNLIRRRYLIDEAAALIAGTDDPVAMAIRTNDRIDEIDGTVRAFVAEPGRRDRLRTDAEALIRRWPDPQVRPALFGVPVAVKDIVHVDGLPTRAGSALPPEGLAGAQASVVDRLRHAGAVVAGKTVTAEFAVAAPGPTRNPHSLGHTPGGSSSGSAAAVAAGMVALAIGTQTIGSVIRPAAYCGVVGFKPTYGRIPTDGVIANARSLDTIGVFADSVAAVALAASVLCTDWLPSTPAGGEPVLGIPVGPYLRHAGDEALAAFDAQVHRVRDAGFTVLEVPVLPDFDQIVRLLLVINRYELAEAHSAWFARYGDVYREQTASAIRQGQQITPDVYAGALRDRDKLRDLLTATMGGHGIDSWIAPSATGPAPDGLVSTGDPIMCLPWSAAGMPSLNLPAGSAANGLPFGLQCIGRVGGDESLLYSATAIETALQRF
jgi:Asp-tRNA(Asn)/Glu-tRNA(Gln) amidotransferase A subunit family amidase